MIVFQKENDIIKEQSIGVYTLKYLVRCCNIPTNINYTQTLFSHLYVILSRGDLLYFLPTYKDIRSGTIHAEILVLKIYHTYEIY